MSDEAYKIKERSEQSFSLRGMGFGSLAFLIIALSCNIKTIHNASAPIGLYKTQEQLSFDVLMRSLLQMPPEIQALPGTCSKRGWQPKGGMQRLLL